MDEYDVDRMIRDTVKAVTAEIASELHEVRRLLANERTERELADAALARMVESRTEHLV